MIDFGDVLPDRPDREGMLAAVAPVMRSVVSSRGLRPLSLGGDHSVTFPLTKALREQVSAWGLKATGLYPERERHRGGRRLGPPTRSMIVTAHRAFTCPDLCSLPLLTTQVGRPFVIVHFDAHPDLYPDFEGNPSSHASPFARILEEGKGGICSKASTWGEERL